MMIGSNNGIIENKSFIVHIYQQEIYIKNDYNLAAVKILVLYEKIRIWYQACEHSEFYNRWFTPICHKDCISFWY